jgi:hypothetical protein
LNGGVELLAWTPGARAMVKEARESAVIREARKIRFILAIFFHFDFRFVEAGGERLKLSIAAVLSGLPWISSEADILRTPML